MNPTRSTALTATKLAVILLGLIITAKPSMAQTPAAVAANPACVAQVITARLTYDQIVQRAVAGANSVVFANLIAGPVPPEFNRGPPNLDQRIDQQAWTQVHTSVESEVKSYYNNSYEPRTVVCVAFTEREYSLSDQVPTYSGTRIILSAFPHTQVSSSDGVLGPNLEVLHKAYDAAVKSATQIATARCGGGPGGAGAFCYWWRHTGQTILSKLQGIDSNFNREPPPAYREYSFLRGDGSQIDSAGLTEFYEDVAAQSYVNFATGGFRTILIGPQKVPLKALFYEPITRNQLVTATSFLDFVDGRFIPELSKYFVDLFRQLWLPDRWRAQYVASSQIKWLNSLVPITKDTSVGVAIATLLCQQEAELSPSQPSTSQGSPRYRDLIAPVHQDYMRDYLALYCKFGDSGQMKVLDATALFKNEDTFPLTAQLVADEQITSTLAGELAKLEALQVDSNQLLNDIKKLTADQTYQTQIARLQAAIKAAEDASNSSFFQTAAAIASLGSGVAGLPNLLQGFKTFNSLLGDMPDHDQIQYLTDYSKGFSDAADKIGSGAGSLQKLGTAVNALTPHTSADAHDVNQLRDALARVQQEYQAVLAEIAAKAREQLGQYADAINTQIKYYAMQQRVVLVEHSIVNRVVMRAIIGARLEQASNVARQLCPLAAEEFVQDPASEDLSAISQACRNYAERAERFRRCLKSQPRKAGFSLLYGGATGLRVADDISISADPNHLSCFGPEAANTLPF